jgi:hypothetical protein
VCPRTNFTSRNRAVLLFRYQCFKSLRFSSRKCQSCCSAAVLPRCGNLLVGFTWNALAGRVIYKRAHSRCTQRFAGANFTAGGCELFASRSRETGDSALVETERERKCLDLTPCLLFPCLLFQSKESDKAFAFAKRLRGLLEWRVEREPLGRKSNGREQAAGAVRFAKRWPSWASLPR